LEPAVTGSAEPDTLAWRAGDAQVIRDVVDQVPVMMISLEGSRHVIRTVNAALRDFAGRSDLIGEPLPAVLAGIAGQQIVDLLDRVYETGIPAAGHEWRVPVRHSPEAQEQEAFIDFAVRPWRAADGTIRGLVATGIEVTASARRRRDGEPGSGDAGPGPVSARDMTASLQAALLPAAVPVLPRAGIAASYLVAGSDDAAGGDWFDAIPLDDGQVALIVGDVVGHGVAATAAMAQLRAVLAELLLAGAAIGAVGDRLDAFAARVPALHAATLALAIMDPESGALQYITCGHPPPLLIAADGTTRFLAGSGAGPLGTGSQQGPCTGTLEPGDVIFLYSDGLIERPGLTLAGSMAELARVAADAAANRILPASAPATAAERVCRLTVELLSRTGYCDDITALAVERRRDGVADIRLTVPSEVHSLRVLRQALTDWLVPLEPRPDDLDAVHMAVVEIVTNAIEHAYPEAEPGPIDFALSLLDDGQVECVVTDYGNWRPPAEAEDDRGNGLMVARHLVEQMQVTHPPSDSGQPGTVVTLRHHLVRPVTMLAEEGAGPALVGAETGFGVITEPVKGAARALVHGVIDITTADQLRRRLLAACKGGTLPLTVDLTGVTRLASAGVSTLFELARQLRLHEHSLALVARAGSPVQAVLDIVRLPHAPGES
jgi:serine phosphatase RsbU (regulator of sigma subunit)/anti-sigma regulatory factor (Ser/Thr protein kinase)/anti-anti-sigma regulatory factor